MTKYVLFLNYSFIDGSENTKLFCKALRVLPKEDMCIYMANMMLMHTHTHTNTYCMPVTVTLLSLSSPLPGLEPRAL